MKHRLRRIALYCIEWLCASLGMLTAGQYRPSWDMDFIFYCTKQDLRKELKKTCKSHLKNSS